MIEICRPPASLAIGISERRKHPAEKTGRTAGSSMKSWNKNKQDRLINILQAFVRHDTTQPDGREAVLARYIEQLFSPFGKRVETSFFDHGNNRASLVVKLNAAGRTGGFAFVGHLDTVAVGDDSLWTYDPHAAKIVDDSLYGRGAADMKGGLAAMTVAALEVLESGVSLKKPLYLVYTADEEKTSNGAAAVGESGILDDVEAILIPEMTGSRIAIAEKGVLWLKVTVHGRTAHGAMPEAGLNALNLAIEFVDKFREHLMIHKPDPLLGKMTASLTRLEGGLMTNVIPDKATLELDCRTLPSINHTGLLSWTDCLISRLETKYEGSSFELEVLAERLPFATPSYEPFVHALQDLAGTYDLKTEPIGVRFATDASRLIPHLNKPFVIMGPGQINMAHQTNEHIALDAVTTMTRLFCDLIENELT